MILSSRRLPFFSHPELATSSRSVSPSLTGFHLRKNLKIQFDFRTHLLYECMIEINQNPLYSIYNSTHLNLSSSLALVKGQLASSKSLKTFQTTLLSEYLENTSLHSHLIWTTSCGIVRRCRPVLWPLLPQVAPVLQQDLNVPELTPCSWLLFLLLVSTYFLFRSGFYFCFFLEVTCLMSPCDPGAPAARCTGLCPL